MTKATFPKSERLSKRDLLRNVFKEGKGRTYAPIRVIYRFNEDETVGALQVCTSVPKRIYAKATDRNRLKRQLREAYRLRKEPLKAKLEEKQRKMSVVLIFIGKEAVSFQALQKQMDRALNWLEGKIE